VNLPPLVSICTPTYNRPTLLVRAIRSVLAQTFTNFEMIITDNSDDDESEQIVRRINDKRIRYLRNEKNIGALENIKKVAGMAEGRYQTVLMDDDLLKPQALELMLEVFRKHPSVGVVMAPMDLIDSNDRRIFPKFYLVRKMYYRYRYQVGDGLVDRATVLREFLTHDYPCCVPSGIMYRTEAVKLAGGFDTKSDFALDLDLDMRIAIYFDFYYIDQVLSSFRYSPVSLTAEMHSAGSNVAAFYYITRKILADPKAMGLFSAKHHKKLRRDSIFFCSCRALMLNGHAGVRARKWSIIRDAIRLVRREDPYLWNKLRLPWFVFREVFRSYAPPAKPLPKE
jgi:glycosyltransferase involved in cell wall biosynthesis